jgi:nucleotide-binding universal stress UspA family protein
MDMILQEIKKNYNEHKVSITTEILIGDPVEKIVDYVKQNNIDLVIMGSVGLRGFSGMIKRIGSVSRSVAEEVSCPVLIMR